MLPRPLSTTLLLGIWLVGLLPYLFISFWLEQTSLGPSMVKVCKVVSDFSMAFASAFPFWFVIEIFQQRKVRHEIARLQNEHLQAIIAEYNFMVLRILSDDPANEKRPSTKDYVQTTHPEILKSTIVHRFLDITNPISGDKVKGSRMVVYGSIFASKCQPRLEALRPYLGNFNVRFTAGFNELADEIEELRESTNKDIFSDDWRSPSRQVASIHINLVRLINIYRTNHRLRPLLNDPAQPPSFEELDNLYK